MNEEVSTERKKSRDQLERERHDQEIADENRARQIRQGVIPPEEAEPKTTTKTRAKAKTEPEPETESTT